MQPKANGNNVVAILCLLVAGFLAWPKIAPYLKQDDTKPVPVVPVNPTPTVTPDATLQPIAAPLLTSLAGHPEVASDFADFYTSLKSSVSRDSGGSVYPTTERFLKVHTVSLLSCYQSRPNYQRYNVGPTIDAVLTQSLGGLDSKQITATERGQIVKALDTIIYTLQQVK